MGMYDTIHVYMECPYCGDHRVFDAQTKDLDPACYSYRPYEKDRLLDRSRIPVFKQNPADKSHKLWKSQDERARTWATIPEKCKDLKFVGVIAGCHSDRCQFDADRDDIIRQGCPSGFGRHFEGKIAIKDGLLVGIIYDIVKDDMTENKLNKWKTLYPKEYRILMKKYKHEPFAARAWNHAIPSYHKITVDVKKKKIKSKLVRFPTIMQPNEVIKQTTTGKRR